MADLPILVIDDNEFIRASMVKFLETNRYKVTGVSSARAAMDHLEQEQFGLIVTDILMPDTDGFELIDYVREGAEPMRSIPVIAISGGGRAIDAGMVLTALEEKVDYVLKKPFSKKDLLDKAGSLMGQSHRSLLHRQTVIAD